MSLQWTFIAVFLYTEVFLVALLLIPFFSASRWQKIFKSRLLTGLAYYSNIYFNILIAILVLLFLDSIRDVRKYTIGHGEIDLKANPMGDVQIHMKLFRAQRNFYIAGIALFLWIVLRRLVTLISEQASLQAKNEAAIKQAQGAADMAKKLMEEKENKDNEKDESQEKSVVEAKMADYDRKIKEKNKEIDSSRDEIDNLKEVLASTQKNFDAMKKQAEATNTEYDRLLEEHSTLQKQIESGEDKKDN